MSADTCLICDRQRTADPTRLVDGEHAVLLHYPCDERTPEVYRGHLFVEPKRHVTVFGEPSDDEAAEVGRLMAAGSRLLTGVLSAEHVYVFSIQHLVAHVHIHVVPRYPGTPEEHWGGTELVRWEGGPRIEADEVERVVSRLREAL